MFVGGALRLWCVLRVMLKHRAWRHVYRVPLVVPSQFPAWWAALVCLRGGEPDTAIRALFEGRMPLVRRGEPRSWTPVVHTSVWCVVGVVCGLSRVKPRTTTMKMFLFGCRHPRRPVPCTFEHLLRML